MRVLVCGTRTWEDSGPVWLALSALHAEPRKEQDFTVISGGARGADALAAAWAFGREDVVLEEYKADWNLGKRAGYLRNVQMLKAEPELVLAFGYGLGTNMMVRLATEAGVRTFRVVDENADNLLRYEACQSKAVPSQTRLSTPSTLTNEEA